MKAFADEIKENDNVDSLFLVREKSSGVTKNGSLYLKLKLGDRSGEVEGRVWTLAETFNPLFERDDFVRVTGKAVTFQGQLQVNIARIERVGEEAVELSDFFPRTERNVDDMLTSLVEISREVKDPHLGALLSLFLGDTVFLGRFKVAPASKWIHHNYLGGLLEHTLSLAELVLKNGCHYQGLSLDLLLTGAMLHDVGKIDELSYRRSLDYSDEGRLLGHIILGVEMIEDRIRQIPDFPKELAILVKHLIVSHHGQDIWGSPKKPMILEAVMLHYLDDMDAKMNGIRQFMKTQLPEGSKWTAFHRVFSQSFYSPSAWNHLEFDSRVAGGEPERTE
jgi:3'-5' exoribonuclease